MTATEKPPWKHGAGTQEPPRPEVRGGTTPLTVQALLGQPLKELDALAELLAEALGHKIVHVALPQQLLKRTAHAGQVLAVAHADAVALLEFLAPTGGLAGWQREQGVRPKGKKGTSSTTKPLRVTIILSQNLLGFGPGTLS